ncbi:MAG: sugar ABC transporter substrate-binding protein [Oscillospiraceae bacterium]|nr:sugar ABC transporter substrate-binding protein [Oscillospiraceae bacterium]
MRKITAVIALLLTAVMTAALLSACVPIDSKGSGGGGGEGIAVTVKKDPLVDKIRIAFIQLSSDNPIKSILDLAATEQMSVYKNNLTITFMDGQHDPGVQSRLVEDCITQKYDAIIIEPASTEAVNSAILEAEESGIPVITFNTGCSAVHSLHIQGADYATGYAAATILAESIGRKGTAVLIDAPADQKINSRMGTGFEDCIVQNYPDIKIIERAPIDEWSADKASEEMANILTRHSAPGSINIVYCASDSMAGGVVTAIENAGREKDGIKVYGNIGYPEGLALVRDGKLYGTSFSDMYVLATIAYTHALYFIRFGLSADVLGLEETPVRVGGLIPVIQSNAEQISGVSRWRTAIPGVN